MKKPNLHRLAALAACLLCCTYFTIPAYAQSSEPQAETTPAETEAPEEPAEPNPFTPNGTGTVVDKATDKDGKEFYTITTPDENIFFLVIDKQRWTRGYKRYKETRGLIEWKECQIFHSIFT